jgi:hypothetical protein
MHRLHLLAVAAAAACVVAMPTASASGVFAGPFGFYFESDTCFASTLNGLIFVGLTNADGIVSGNAVTASPSVTMVLNGAPPAGYVVCENLPGGGFRSYGDGSGVIVAS